MQWLILFSCLAALASSIPWDTETAFDRYVQGDDGFFTWNILEERSFNRCRSFVVNMTSQKWMDETYVDRPIWFHYMSIVIPDEDLYTYKDFGFLLIGSGSNDDSPPEAEDASAGLLCRAARDTGGMAGLLFQTPNQPLHFVNDPKQMRRTEDRVIAYTWRMYIDTMRNDIANLNPEVILRFPMTKGAKRALDTMDELGQQETGVSVSRFGVAGGSKRGWTTWSLAATDQRVTLIAPLVFSMLNMEPTIMAHFRALDGWSFAFEPYYNENLTQEFKTREAFFCDQDPPGAMCYEDMYHYFDRLALIPIYQLVSTGDEFFLLQDSHFWWDYLLGLKWTYMLENAEHSMAPWYLKLYETLTSFIQHYLRGIAMPRTDWTFEYGAGSGRINFTVSPPPLNVTAWRAVTLSNDTRRDFRLADLDEEGNPRIHPVRWDNDNMNFVNHGNGLYSAETNEEPGEWVGMNLNAEWAGPDGQRFILGTETIVLPDTFPTEECTDEVSCYGELR